MNNRPVRHSKQDLLGLTAEIGSSHAQTTGEYPSLDDVIRGGDQIAGEPRYIPRGSLYRVLSEEMHASGSTAPISEWLSETGIVTRAVTVNGELIVSEHTRVRSISAGSLDSFDFSEILRALPTEQLERIVKIGQQILDSAATS